MKNCGIDNGRMVHVLEGLRGGGVDNNQTLSKQDHGGATEGARA